MRFSRADESDWSNELVVSRRYDNIVRFTQVNDNVNEKEVE